MDYSTKLAIAKASTNDLLPRLYRRSVGFLTPDGDDLILSSGTLVRIGDRLFVCTASHTVPRTGDDIWVLSGEPTISTAPHAPIINRGFIPGDDPDVGFLELATNAETEFLKKEACSLSSLAIRGVGRPLRPTLLIGNPAEYVKKTEFNQRQAYIPQITGFFTVPLQSSEWPERLNANPDKHLILDYPNTPGMRMDNGVACSPKVEPSGMRVLPAPRSRRTPDETHPTLARADHPPSP